MPTTNTMAIVLGRTNFGEADRIVRLLTPDMGKISAVAKGVRKIKGRLAGHLEPLSESSLVLASGRNLDVVTQARLKYYPHKLTASYTSLTLAFSMVQAVDRLTEPDQPQVGLYELLSEAIHALDEGASGPLPELWFKLRLLEVMGYRPELTACLICGQGSPEVAYAFSPAKGGIVCATHMDPGTTNMQIQTIKFWRLLADHPYATVSRIAGAAELATKSLELCDEFYTHHLGRSFRVMDAT